MAATKEALVIILDVGPSMNQAPPGVETDLQISVDAVTKILQRKMFSQSKDEIALVLFGTDDTANDLADGESYENVTLARPLGLVDWELLKYVQNDVQPGTGSGDFLDAAVVAMDHLVKGIQGKRGFGSKRIVLFSNLGGEFGDDELNDIIASLKEAEINFDIIGPDLDADDGSDSDRPGPSNGHVKAKSPQQRAGEALARHLLQNVDGDNFSFQEVLPTLSHFQSRQVRSVAWKSQLTIGSDLQIPICLYNRIKEVKPNTFKSVYAKDPDAPLERVRTYHLNDEEETEIEKSDVVDGHRYGSTLVPFSADDKDAMKYKTEKCLNLLCFAANDVVKHNLLMGDATWVCMAEKGDETAATALSAFINAMYELNSVAIVRRVYAANSQVRIGCLVPHIKNTHECLIYNELPFSEDMRQFTFGSLPVKEENTAANKKQAPTDEQLKLMDDLIDNMDLNTAVKDEDDEDGITEALKPKLTFNPHLQRLYQCLQHRALNPDDPLPTLSEVVAQSLTVPAAVEVQCQATIDEMKDKYKLKLVAKDKKDETAENVFKANDQADGPPAKKAKKENEDLKGGMAELVKAKVTKIDTVSPVADFKDLLNQKDQDLFETACDMMKKIITQLIMESFGSQSYGKAIDCLKVLREETAKNYEPKVFNDFLAILKDQLLQKGRSDFWDEIVQDKVTLISKVDCEDSKVTTQEAKDFLSIKEDIKQPDTATPSQDAAEDLLDDF